MSAPPSDRAQLIAARWSALDDKLTNLENSVAQRLADASAASHDAGTGGTGSARDAPPSQADSGLNAQILGSREDTSAGPLQVSTRAVVCALGLCMARRMFSTLCALRARD